jgi:Domain of unknown function (DUF1707)
VTAGPGNQMAAGRGSIRSSRAEREQVIELLKAAFVQGRLTADELDVRLGQAFASRTYAELAAVTADIPVDLVRAQPRPALARAKQATGAKGSRPPMSTKAKVAICLMIVAVTLVVSYFTDTYAFAMFAFFYVMALIVAAAQVLFSCRDQRSRPRHDRQSRQRGAIRAP